MTTAVDLMRDALFGNPAVASYKPDRQLVLNAFSSLSDLISVTGLGISYFTTRASLIASGAPTGSTPKVAIVTSDSTSANNTVYTYRGSSWVVFSEFYNSLLTVVQPSIDAITATANSAYAASVTNATAITTLNTSLTSVIGRVTTVESAIRITDDTIGYPLVIGGTGANAYVPVWLDRLTRFEAAGVGPGFVSLVGKGLKLDTSKFARTKVPLVTDKVTVFMSLINGAIDIPLFSVKTQARIRTLTRAPVTVDVKNTDGKAVRVARAKIGHLSLANVKTQKLHYLLAADSFGARPALPQGIVDDFRIRLGITVVATGYMAFAPLASNITTQLGDGTQTASETFTGGYNVVTITSGFDSGQYSPEGLRLIHTAGDTTSGSTIVWKGKRITLYHLANGAAFSYATDGGTVTPTTTGVGGAPSKTVIEAAGEGWHTTVITRPIAAIALERYGNFAASDLTGLTFSKMANGETKFTDWSVTMGTATGIYILADVAANLVQINLLGNDALANTDPTTVATAFGVMVAAFRTANSAVEIFYALRPQNGVAGFTQGRYFADYIPALLGACDSLAVDMINHLVDLPNATQATFFYDSDLRHLNIDGGAGPYLAAVQRRTLWGGF